MVKVKGAVGANGRGWRGEGVEGEGAGLREGVRLSEGVGLRGREGLEPMGGGGEGRGWKRRGRG